MHAPHRSTALRTLLVFVQWFLIGYLLTYLFGAIPVVPAMAVGVVGYTAVSFLKAWRR